MRRWFGETSGGDKRNEAGDEDIDNTRETKKRKYNAKWLTGLEWLFFIFPIGLHIKALKALKKEIKSEHGPSHVISHTLASYFSASFYFIVCVFYANNVNKMHSVKLIFIFTGNNLASGNSDGW